jgi:hypothetical protein
MAYIGFALTSVISLFFSLIFSTMIFQRKRWHLLFISLSLCLLSITSFSLFVGHFFAWYEWTTQVYTISYALIIPTLLGFILTQMASLFYPKSKLWIGLLYFIALIVLGSNTSYLWVASMVSILFIVISLALWIRRQGIAYLWFSCSGLLFYILNYLHEQEQLNLLLLNLGLFIIMLLLAQATAKLFQAGKNIIEIENE